MREGRQHIFPVYYAPGKKLFHIVVKLSDAPGSYSSILELLSKKVNLVGTTTYSLSDGTAMFSGVSEALSKKETAKNLEGLILKSKAAVEAHVTEGEDGLLVDTFHTGYVVQDEDYMLQRRAGMVHMFDQVSKILGSGGESLLYEEGLALSRWNAEKMMRDIGEETVRAHTGTLNRFLAAQGWGEIKGGEDPGAGEYSVVITDCFECSGNATSRPGCNFMRGYLVGAIAAFSGREMVAVESKCVFRGSKVCEFHLSSK